MVYIKEEHMKGFQYIKAFRDYIDYIEEHLENVIKAFNELSIICKGMWWVTDDYKWHTLREEVVWHDISKFSKEEFTEYREAFYPVGEKGRLDKAWEHHKKVNSHHHESLKKDIDVVHMVIDWTAMGYKFGDTAQEYYERNKNKIKLMDWQKDIMYEIFDRIREHK